MTDEVYAIGFMMFLLLAYMFLIHFLYWVSLYRWVGKDGTWLELCYKPQPPMPWYDLFTNFYKRDL